MPRRRRLLYIGIDGKKWARQNKIIERKRKKKADGGCGIWDITQNFFLNIQQYI